MTSASTPSFLLEVRPLTKALYAALAGVLTGGLFALLPVADAVGRKTGPKVRLTEAPLAAARRQEFRKRVERSPPSDGAATRPAVTPARAPAAQPRRRSVPTLTPRALSATPYAASLGLSASTLQGGLGDVSLRFGVLAAEPSESASPPAVKPFVLRDLDAPPPVS